MTVSTIAAAAAGAAQPMHPARLQATADGAILFDPACAAQADGAWFDAAAWRDRGLAERADAGRGDAWFLRAPWGASVLRHYRRGGLVARVLGDRYLWTGAERTRCFAEFRLLQELLGRGLPVPAPVAARYVRRGLHYRADLITRRIVGAETLAARLASSDADADLLARVGATVAEFHAAGAFHADLNAHNVLLTEGRVWLIDFDRGARRTPARAWQQANLARLRRSLHKVLPGRAAADIDARLWAPLSAAHAARLAQTASGGRGA